MSWSSEEEQLIRVNRTSTTELNLKSSSPEKTVLLRNTLSISTNVASVVGIVLVNKIIFSHYNFPFGIFLTIVHFLMTTAILVGLAKVGVFQAKKLPVPSVVPLSACFCGFVVLTNLSLKYNSVAFYQMAKVLTTPIVALIQGLLYGLQMRTGIKATLGLTCLGVLGATLKEVTVSAAGTLVALLSVFVTAWYQVLIGSTQQSLEANSMQLLLYQAPLSALMLMAICPFSENPHDILTFPYTTQLIISILGSSVLAALVNVSTFLIIGQTSAITYNVVGHCKLCLVLLFGFFAFDHESLTLINLSGILIALCGIIGYSYIKVT